MLEQGLFKHKFASHIDHVSVFVTKEASLIHNTALLIDIQTHVVLL